MYKVEYRAVDKDDITAMGEYGELIKGRTKLVVTDAERNSAVLYMDDAFIKKYGKRYIDTHCSLYFSASLNEWFVKFDEADYYNDIQRNPIKIIEVDFVGREGGTGRSIYKSKDGILYYREDYAPREDVARWYYIGERIKIDCGDEVRANLIFQCQGMCEKVECVHGCGVMAHGANYNSHFQ